MARYATAEPFQSELTYFRWPEFKKSYVAVSFSDWKLMELTEKSSTGHYISMILPIGVHQYRFQVDGQWRTDPSNDKPLVNGLNQVEVLPILPACIPNFLKGASLGHLYLCFPSSFAKDIVHFVHNCGLKGILISIIVLDPSTGQHSNQVNACALLRQDKDGCEETYAQQCISDSITDKAEMKVLRFRKNSISTVKSKSISPQRRKVVLNSALPDYIVSQHIREHFGYFSSHIERVGKQDLEQKFFILFHLADRANEAMSVYNNSILKGIRIQISLVDVGSADCKTKSWSEVTSDTYFGEHDVNSVSTIDSVDFPKHSMDTKYAKYQEKGRTRFDKVSQICEPDHVKSEAASIDYCSKRIKVFVYSKPRFSKSVCKEDLMDHFKNFDPVDAYLIKDRKTKEQTGTGVVVFLSESAAECAISEARGSRMLGEYSISLKPEHPPLESTKEYCRSKHSSCEPDSPSGTPRKDKADGKKVPPACPFPLDADMAKANYSSTEHVASEDLKMMEKDNDLCSGISTKSEPKTSSQMPPVASNKISKRKQSSGPAATSPSEHSVKIKVSRIPQGTTVKNLKKYFQKFGPLDGTPELHLTGRPPYSFVKFKHAESAVMASNVKNPQLKGSSIKICMYTKETKAENSKPMKAKPKDYVTESITLEPAEWNMLMTKQPKLIQPTCSTLLQVIISSYSTEDVTCSPLVESSSLDVKGKRKLVDLMCDDIKCVLDNGELSIDRLILQALIYLKPSLPDEIKECYKVNISGFEQNSSKIQFFGHNIEGIKKAHESVGRLVAKLYKSERKLKLNGQFPEDKLKSLRDIISRNCFVCLPQAPPLDLIILYTLEDSFKYNDNIVAVANSILESTKVVDLSPDQLRFLMHFGLPSEEQIPAAMSIDGDKVCLSGTSADIETSEAVLRDEILSDCHCQTFSYFCEGDFVSQIEKNMLSSFKKDDDSFIWKFYPESLEQKLTIIVSSKKQEVFLKACKELENLEPKVETFSVGLPPDDFKRKLELKHKIVINCIARDSVQICGLSSDSIDECYKELVDKLEETETESQSVSIDKYQYQYFFTFNGDDIEELNKICRVCLSVNEEVGNCSIEVSGTVKQVKLVREKLKSGLLALNIHGESFQISCPSVTSLMWCTFWDKLIKQESKPCLNVKYKKCEHKSSIDFFSFQIVGTEIDMIQKIKDLIYDSDKGTETIEEDMDFSSAEINTLLEAKRDNRLEFIKDLDICIVDITRDSVKVCTPKSLEDSFIEGLEKIREFVLANTRVSVLIESQDPVVQLVLSSNETTEAYLKSACSEVEKYNAEVEFVPVSVNKEIGGFRVTANEALLSCAADCVRNVTFNAIRNNIFRKVVEFDALFRPLLATSEFDKVIKKLEKNCWVIGSLSSKKCSNSLLYTASSQITTERKKVKVNIHVVNGNVVLERTDCIVNFATDKLDFQKDHFQAICEEGGPSIQGECSKYLDATKELPIECVFCTKAGNLACKYIIHAIFSNWSKNNLEEDVLFGILSKVFEVAKDNSLTSISIPIDSSSSISTVVLYAHALLRVIEDHHRNFSSSLVCDIRVVLESNRMTAVFCDAVVFVFNPLLQFFEKHSRVKSAKQSNTAYTWSWENDTGDYSPYSPDQNSELSMAYNSNPRGSCSVRTHRAHYIVDFASMTQTNARTQYVRKITKTEQYYKVEWKYMNNQSTFTPYSKLNSALIEESYQTKVLSCSVIINSAQYRIDFETMSQINVRTKFERKIQRHVEYKEDTEDASDIAQEPLTIVLRGVCEKLPRAEEILREFFNKCIKSEQVDDIPVNLPKEVKDEILKITDSNKVKIEFQTSSDETAQSLNLKGVDYMVQKSIISIQRELIKFKAKLKPDQYVFATPPEWETQTSEVELFDVTRGNEEWNSVEQKFSATMHSHSITRIQRIQNKFVWKRYSFQKKYLEEKNGEIVIELHLFHGSRKNKPKEIYEGEAGFDMRFSREGMWGHANYFAVNASYSHSYAYSENSNSFFGLYYNQSLSVTKQMFLAAVLIGDYYECSPNHTLRMPPMKSFPGNMRYDSVKGHASGSDVYMTYDNEKAYPAYLISYQ